MIFTIGIYFLIFIALILALTMAVVYYRFRGFPEADTEVRIWGLTRHTNGYAEGKLLYYMRGKERSVIEFQPYINKRAKKYLKSKVTQSVRVVVQNDKIIEISRGKNDQFSNFLHCLAPTPDMFDKDFKNSIIGMTMVKLIESDNIEKLEDRIKDQREQVVNKLLSEKAGLQAVLSWFKENKEIEKIKNKKLEQSNPVGRPPKPSNLPFSNLSQSSNFGAGGS